MTRSRTPLAHLYLIPKSHFISVLAKTLSKLINCSSMAFTIIVLPSVEIGEAQEAQKQKPTQLSPISGLAGATLLRPASGGTAARAGPLVGSGGDVGGANRARTRSGSGSRSCCGHGGGRELRDGGGGLQEVGEGGTGGSGRRRCEEGAAHSFSSGSGWAAAASRGGVGGALGAATGGRGAGAPWTAAGEFPGSGGMLVAVATRLGQARPGLLQAAGAAAAAQATAAVGGDDRRSTERHRGRSEFIAGKPCQRRKLSSVTLCQCPRQPRAATARCADSGEKVRLT
uniref:Uncharacterized protein n=1 Tax=Ananas comosus var. bracteatus TaxID=296719 RepID=A0A6V7NP82_ANACO|nr:unnamed protein product [Ananas comosus var. bracteatus]